jgi:hypothetical protein
VPASLREFTRLASKSTNLTVTLGVVVVASTTSIRRMEPVYRGPPRGWGKALGWVALAAVGVLALIVVATGASVEWSDGSPIANASRGFDLSIVPLKHPAPDAKFYCSGISWFSAALPNPQLIAAEVNSAPNATAHRAALKFYSDLVEARSTSGDLAGVEAAYTCPTGG